MTVDDLPAVVALDRRSFSLPWSEASFRSDLTTNAAAHLFVAEEAGAADGPIGYAGFWLILDEAHLSTLAVDPGRRRRGYGEALLREAVRRASTRGAAQMTLEVRRSNAAARRLYQRLGFVEVGRRKGYYRDNLEDAILMTLDGLAAAVAAAEAHPEA